MDSARPQGIWRAWRGWGGGGRGGGPGGLGGGAFLLAEADRADGDAAADKILPGVRVPPPGRVCDAVTGACWSSRSRKLWMPRVALRVLEPATARARCRGKARSYAHESKLSPGVHRGETFPWETLMDGIWDGGVTGLLVRWA